jgi:hypothetical protein
MTRTIARQPSNAPFITPLATLLAFLLVGCAGGLIGPLPRVAKPSEASTVTVFRDFSLPGFVGPMVLRIEGCETFRLWVNQEFSFQLDPGQYFFDYTIGFNECRRVAYIQPRHNYRFRLTPNCTHFDSCVTQAPSAAPSATPSATTAPPPGQGVAVGANSRNCGTFDAQCF